MPVRQLALFLEESLYRWTEWVVFEPINEFSRHFLPRLGSNQDSSDPEGCR
jgi:hypothetical protein